MDSTTSQRVCILGFGINVSEQNLELAREAGKELAEAGLITVSGNLQGTFFEAIESSHKVNGKTALIITEDITDSIPVFCKNVEIVKNTEQKHNELVNTCCAVIIIGGGDGSKQVIDMMIKHDRKVVAIAGSGGIADSYISDKIFRTTSVKEGINWIKQN